MLIKKILWILALLVSTLVGSVDFPQVYTVFKKTDDADRIMKIVLSKDQKRLLVMRHNSVSLMDAKNFKVIKKITFKGSAWDCDFAEKGFVLLTHHDFTYYDDTGTNRLYYTERRDGGQIAKMDMQKNGYIVNLIKEIDRPKKDDIVKRILEMQRTGNTADIAHLNQSEKGLVTLNLRTKEYTETVYKTDFKAKHYLNDIRDNVLKISTGSHTYDYINILTGKKVKDFPGKNILPNGKQIIDAKELILQDIPQKKVIQSYTKPTGRYKFGCMDSSGKRFAILTTNEPVYVYDIDKSEPIFSLPRNLNTSKTRDCLLYDDTLILWGKSMQAYNIKDAKKIENAMSRSLEVMPIIGSCTDASYGVSLWVNTMYGWDIEKGQMLWYSIGPEFNRSHWENASYLIKMQSDDKIAFVQPYGQRDYKELRVNLENGTFIDWEKKKHQTPKGKAKVCDPHGVQMISGEVWLEKEFSFIQNGVSFYALSQGEWLVISNNDGYFNASSKEAISLLHKAHKALTDEDIKKWYRPDIIEAKLAQNSIEDIKNKEVYFTLPTSSSLLNQYRNSLVKQIVEGKDYKKLSNILLTATNNELTDIKHAIEKVDSSEGYFAFYSALVKRKFTQDEVYIQERIKHLATNSKEEPELIRYLARKNKNELIEEITSKQTLQDSSKKAIASAHKDLDYSEAVLWDVWENQNFIYDKVRLEFLNKKAPEKAHILAVRSLTYILMNLEQKCSTTNEWAFEDICQSEISRQRDGAVSGQIKMLYEFLTTNNIKVQKQKLKDLTFQMLKRFTSNSGYTFFGEGKVLTEFYMQYATKNEKERLINLNREFLEKAIFKTDWNGPSWGQTQLSSLRIKVGEMIRSMKAFDIAYIQNIESRIINSDNMKMREALVGSITDFKNEETANTVIQNVLKREKKSGFVDNSYINKLLDTKDKKILLKIIDMFNQFDDCNKIRDWYRYKLKEVLNPEEYMRLECDPLPNENVPYKKKEEYEPLYKTMQKE